MVFTRPIDGDMRRAPWARHLLLSALVVFVMAGAAVAAAGLRRRLPDPARQPTEGQRLQPDLARTGQRRQEKPLTAEEPQLEAARALGLNQFQVLSLVVMPQALEALAVVALTSPEVATAGMI